MLYFILYLALLVIPEQESKVSNMLTKKELDEQLITVQELRDVNPDSSFRLSQKYLWNAKLIGHLNVIPYLYHNLGAIVARKGEHGLAITYIDSAYRSASGVIDDQIFYTRLKSFSGTVYADMGNYDKAITIFDEALQDSKLIQDTSAIIVGYMRLGIIFDRMDLIDQCRKSFLTALELANSINDITNTYNLLNNLAVSYARREEYDQALPYFLQAEALEKEHNPAGVAPSVLGNIGRIYLLTGNLRDAEIYLTEAVSKANERQLSLIEAQNSNSLGILLMSQEKWEDAEYWMRRALALSMEYELLDEQNNSYGNLKTLLVKLNRFEEAYYVADEQMELQEALNQIQRFEISKEIEAKYKIEATNSELELLKELNILNRKQRNYAGLALIITTAFSVILVLLYKKQQRTAKKLQLEKIRLKLANETKSRLFSIIGHDLRNPIGGIINGLNLIMDEDSSKEEKEDLSTKIKQLGDETLKTLEDLLLWGRVASYKTNPDYISIAQNLKPVLKINQEQARQKNISLTLIEPEENLMVFADANEFTFILRNFMSNAVKFTSSGGEIRIGVEYREKGLAIYVQDNGIGMKPERLEKIRNREKLVSESGTNKEVGTGIGLLMCHELADKNNAYIEVESEQGKGSRFSLVFKSAT